MYPLIRIKNIALAAILATLVLTSSHTTLHAQPARASAGLPSLGDNAELSAAAERQMGDRIATSIYRDPDYLDDPVLWDYVQGIWQPLMAAARARGEVTGEVDERFAWHVFLMRDRSINAFALPGGYLGVHTGLISAVSNRDELAAVLAHELSHVTQRHISRLVSQQTNQAPWMVGAMILGMLAASKNPQAANAIMAGGQAMAIQNQLNFSRDMEREADRIGFGVMTDAGFDGRGTTGMFEKLQQAARLNDGGGFAYLRTHPMNTERIGDAQARLQLLTNTAAKPDAQTIAAARQQALVHAMMAARARVLSEPGADVMRSLAEQALRVAPKAGQAAGASNVDPRDVGALYGGALVAMKARDHTTATGYAAKLGLLLASDTADLPARQSLALLQLELALARGVVAADAAGIDINTTSLRAALFMQSRVLLASNRAPEVSARLSSWVAERPQDAGAWQLLAQAYGNQNLSARAIRSDAEAQVARYDYAAALDRLRAAQAMLRSNPASGDFMDASIIDTRARRVELLVSEQALQDKLDRKLQHGVNQ